MSTPESTFYVTGGTLRHDAPSYVERQADKDLLDGLLKGEFCYVLTSRQMGKSSLMVRAASKLREQGIQAVVLDLTAIGQNLTPEQWYDGLLARIGRQVRLEGELEDFWEANGQLGPCQRLFTAIREVVLPRLNDGREKEPNPESARTDHGSRATNHASVVIFVDELDVVRSLPFSTDEFFAAIRECYNRRTEDAEFDRLTFCLLGVASPGDLIHDTRTTPFNIGRRIELNDFTEAEAAPLANGLTHPKLETSTLRSTVTEDGQNVKVLLQRVLYWTNGHPYLTQRLCHSIASDGGVTGPASVDGLCEALFLSARARERDDNLLFVRDRLLRSEVDLASLLHVYEDVRAQKRVRDDEANPLIALLRLSGVARVVEGYLWVRNRIYFRVFDREWVRINMPGAEVRRQRAAFWRGVVRATSIAVVMLATLGVLAGIALRQSRRATSEAKRAEAENLVARRNLYAADMSLAQRALEENNMGRTLELLEKHRPRPSPDGREREDLRGWEWRHLWLQCQGDELFTLGTHSNVASCVTFHPEGRLVASGSIDRTIKVWDVQERREVRRFSHGQNIYGLAFSPDGKWLASSGLDQTVKVWEVASWTLAYTITNEIDIYSVRFSPDSRLLAGAGNTAVKIWQVPGDRVFASFVAEENWSLPKGLAFSPDQKLFAYHAGGGILFLWDVEKQSTVASWRGHKDTVHSLAFSPDGTKLVSGSFDRAVKVWDVATRNEIKTIGGFGGWVGTATFSPDGTRLATASTDQRVILWDAQSWKELAALKGHVNEVWALAYSPDGKIMVTVGKDDTVRVWGAAPPPKPKVSAEIADVRSYYLSPEGNALLTIYTNDTYSVWDTAALQEGERRPVPVAHNYQRDRFFGGAISGQGKRAALGDEQGNVAVWETATGRLASQISGVRGKVDQVALSSDGNVLAVATSQHELSVWNVGTTNRITVFDTRPPYVLELAFSPDDRALAAGYGDWTAEVWSLTERKKRALLSGHKWRVINMAFSPDGQTIATASEDAKVRWWDIATQKEIATFGGQLLAFYCVAYSPDGRRLAGGGADGTIKVWDLVSRQEVATLKSHGEPIYSIGFLPDGNTIVSVSKHAIKLWKTATFAETDTPQRAVPPTIAER